MKKRVLILAAAMLLCLTCACGYLGADMSGSVNPAVDSSAIETSESAGSNLVTSTEPEPAAYKIGILTAPESLSGEAFSAVQDMKALYGEKIVTGIYPENFHDDAGIVVSSAINLAADPSVKAIVIVQAVSGTARAITKIREIRPDMLFICAMSGEEPRIIADAADIVLQADELYIGATIPEKAAEMGADTLVYYSFSREMGYPMSELRHEKLAESCQALDVHLVEAEAPDPAGEYGIAGMSAFIMEDVPKKVGEFGQNTAFYAVSCSMQEPLIRAALAEKAIFVQQCCPSPGLGYPGALGLGANTDIVDLFEQIKEKVDEAENSGRMATWRVSLVRMATEACVRYAVEYCEGRTVGNPDFDLLHGLLDNAAGGLGLIDVSSGYRDGDVLLKNYYLIRSDTVVFGP